jgi:hypothetical protein
VSPHCGGGLRAALLLPPHTCQCTSCCCRGRWLLLQGSDALTIILIFAVLKQSIHVLTHNTCVIIAKAAACCCGRGVRALWLLLPLWRVTLGAWWGLLPRQGLVPHV